MDLHQRFDHSSRLNMYHHYNLHPENESSPVPPSPKLRLKIKEDLELLLGSSSGLMSTMLRVQPCKPIGMNDVLIHRGRNFPIDTSIVFGQIDDVPRLTAALDIASSSSVSETIPNVVGKEMECAVTVVGFTYIFQA